MDKYELVLDIIEHPDNYSTEQLAEILSDAETRELYNLLCKTDSAIKANKEINVNAEWKIFSQKYYEHSHRNLFRIAGHRAASIAAIAGTSIAAVAAGIVVSMAVIEHKQKPLTDDITVAPSVFDTSTDTITVNNDFVVVDLTPIMFEDETLEKIIKEIADTYGVTYKFNNQDVTSLHLYYKFDPSLSVAEVVDQLNTFEQINIKQNGNILTID